MSYFVSRQRYYYSGESLVEVAQGGLDYAGSDMLVAAYRNLGEGEEYLNPVEAAEAAIAIRKAWQRDKPADKIGIAIGDSHGMGLEFEPDSDESVLKIAKELYEKLPKCDQCGELLPKEFLRVYEIDDSKFCSEYCCEKAYQELVELNDEA